MRKYIQRSPKTAQIISPNLKSGHEFCNKVGSPKIKTITLHSLIDGEIFLHFLFPNEDQAKIFLESLSLKINQDVEKVKAMFKWRGIKNGWGDFSCDMSLESKKSYLSEVMQAAHELDPFDDETKKEIESVLEIEIYPNEYFTELMKHDFSKALATAENLGGDYLFQLGKQCESIYSDDQQKAIDCYSMVPKGHAVFNAANDSILHLLLRTDPSKLSKVHRLQLVEMKFQSALHSGNTAFPDQLFHELCGYKGLSPLVKNVKGDPETLIAVALQIRRLQQQVNALKSVQSSNPIDAGLFSQSAGRDEHHAETANTEESEFLENSPR